jgi:hypothetical protein
MLVLINNDLVGKRQISFLKTAHTLSANFFTNSIQYKSPFGLIEFLRNQFLKIDGPPNEIVFAPVFRN